MGSFAYTCAVSGLPIEIGDRVRYFLLTKNPYHDGAENTCYVHDLWFPRTLPLRASYNDYGSVEEVEAGPARDIWIEGLKRDLIEQGWGDNTVHDVPTSKEMSFDELLGAVQEGRVSVKRDVDSLFIERSRQQTRNLREFLAKAKGLAEADAVDEVGDAEPEETGLAGVPTLTRVTAIIADAGFPLSAGSGDSGFMIDELEYGCVRVRWHNGYSGKAGITDAQKLGELLPSLQDYAAMVAAGSGPYAHSADLLIRPKPGTEGYHGRRERERKPLPVGHAMIREDVWQALLKVRMEAVDLEQIRQDVRREGARRTETMRGDPHERFMSDLDAERNGAPWIFKDTIPFTVGLGTHLELLAEKGPIPDAVLDTVAEFAYITVVLAHCRYQWRPSSSSGPQFGEWGAHLRLAKAILAVAAGKARTERRERMLDAIRSAWWRLCYRIVAFAGSLMVLIGLKKAETPAITADADAIDDDDDADDGADGDVDDAEDGAADDEVPDDPGADDPLSPVRELGEQQAAKFSQCPSCREPTKGSRSASTERTFPYCAKCIARATPATDSWAAEDRGDDPGPFTDL